MSLESGYRATGVGVVHDVDDRTHRVAVDFPTDGVTTDGYRTAWAPHVFRRSFEEHPHPEMVYDHQTGSVNVIGRAVRCESLSTRARLVGAFEDFRAKPKAKRAFNEIKDGTLPGFSFYYTQGRTRPHPSRRGAEVFESARMEDFGPVHHPSIPGAVATGIRSVDENFLAYWRRRFVALGVPADEAEQMVAELREAMERGGTTSDERSLRPGFRSVDEEFLKYWLARYVALGLSVNEAARMVDLLREAMERGGTTADARSMRFAPASGEPLIVEAAEALRRIDERLNRPADALLAGVRAASYAVAAEEDELDVMLAEDSLGAGSGDYELALRRIDRTIARSRSGRRW
jgi:phage head maturation protease